MENMTASEALGLFIAAVLASALNAVAGGGGFIAFPSLVFTQVMPLAANAITAVSLRPGSLASMGAYRRRLSLPFKPLVLLVMSSTLGGIVGAWLVLHTPPAVFTRLVPFLLLAATLLFMSSNRLVKSIATPDRSVALRGRLLFWSAFIQFLVGIYGGYFGAGLGILILASLALTGMEDIHQMNALKVVLVLCNNGLSGIYHIITEV
jgi:hypothetical protein